ncbi:MAG: class I SAM-dependent methyltransferase [Rhodospirillaceae bacterium]
MSSNYQLPDFRRIPDDLRNGRNIREGYQRGWGLQFGDLRAKVAADPLYQEALKLAGGRTVQAEDNRMNLFLLLKFFVGKLPMGHVVEFGSFKGGSAIFMAKVCQVLHPQMQIYAFDTFEGMPETNAAVDAHTKGDFKDVDFDELSTYIRSLGLTNLHLVRGLFDETAPRVLPEIGAIRLSHIDCDIQSAVAYSYDAANPYMVKGGYIALDDALFSSCIGATEVVEDLMIRRDGLNSEQIYPHFVFRAGLREALA